MPSLATCPSCSRKMRLPDGSTGKRLRCKGCESPLRIEADGAGELRLVELSGSAPVAPAPVSSAPSAPSAPSGSPTRRPRGRGRAVRARTRSRARKSAVWLLVIAALFAVGTTVAGLEALKERAVVERELAGSDDHETVVLEDGEAMTVGELRALARLAPIVVFGAGFVVAALMVGLYFWARRRPLAAYLTGLGIFLALVLVQALDDPSNLLQGLVWKVLIVLGLGAGIRAALRVRADEAEEQPA